MTHESRIYKIADTISDLNYFDNIILLGINNGKLEKKEPFKKYINLSIRYARNTMVKNWFFY